MQSNPFQIATIISFCTTEWRYIEACIASVKPFSSQILVTVCDHFFDGEPEDYALLEEVYRRFPEVTFIEFSYDSDRSYRFFSPLSVDHPHWRHLWHNTGRWIALFFVNEGVTHLNFSDADEVTDTERFQMWLSTCDWTSQSVIRFASYRYFREARFQALEHDLTGTLVSRAALDPNCLWSEHERMGIYFAIPGEKAIDVKGLDGRPMIHHYSWVRTESELLKKVKSWGHYWERDWAQLISEEYSHPFNGVDFVRKSKYVTVDPHFDPLSITIPVLEPLSLVEHRVKLFDNVIRVTKEEMFQQELVREFQL